MLAATMRALLRARSAEDEVRRAASEWRTTFEAICDAVAVLDSPASSSGPTARSPRASATSCGRRVAALERARATGELALGERLFSVRFDVVPTSRTGVRS